MSFKAGLKHVLRHCWLWPIQFWLRPLDVINRFAKKGIAESCSAILGGFLWGSIVGIGIWLDTGEIQAIGVLAAAVSIVIASLCPILQAKIDSENIVSSIALTLISAFSFFLGAGAVGIALGGSIFNTARHSVGIINILIGIFLYLALGIFGLSLGIDRIKFNVFLILTLGVLLIDLLILLVFYILDKKAPEWITITVSFACLFLWPLVSFGAFPESIMTQIPIWGFSLTISMSIKMTAGYFMDSQGIWKNREMNLLRMEKDRNWLIYIWTWFSLLALAAWLPNFGTAQLNNNLDKLALFFIVTPFILSGLQFLPLLCVWALWQFRTAKVKRYIPETFANTLPFQWQTFAYPLPGLRSFLFKLCQVQGAKAAFDAIQKVQLGSLQISQARKAAFDLVRQAETALPFCGHVAISTNTATLTPFSITGPVARAVAVLAGKPDKEEEQPLRIFVGDYPPKPLRLPPPFGKPVPAGLEEFETSRQSGLEARLYYAIAQLDRVIGISQEIPPTPLYKGGQGGFAAGVSGMTSKPMPETVAVRPYSGLHLDLSKLTQGPEFRQLLEFLFVYATGNVQNILSLPPHEVIKSNREAARIATPHPTDAEWLIQGWYVVRMLATILRQFNRYQKLTTVDARRDFLQERTNVLRKEEFINISPYWQGIGKELAELWAKRLEEEIKQAREWLRLDIRLTQEDLPLGIQTIYFTINNPTRSLAQKLRVTVEDGEGLEWHHREVKRSLLEGGDEARLGLELETRQVGPLRIAGRLDAEDIAGNVITQPFVFQVRVAEAGKPYQIPPYQPYVIGEGLGEDRTFVGREDLLHWLRGLWLQPQGKPAVALVGQRRIGKTSLLNKISRDGLPDTGLLPVLVNVQGQTGDYDFLNTVAREMAEHLEIAKPVLDRGNPYPDFKDFLLGLKPNLNGRRFLLMLDEADLIPQRGLGEDLPGFLRGLMQEPQYPVLLLFCGTHALKHLGREYYSILFNTAQFRTVSYMSQAESAQVLQKPAGDWLEYDKAVLEEAYRLTKGQPLLLQSIGAKLINRFDEETRQGRKRSTFVNFNDLNAAADDVVKQGNAAFENHWETIDPASHRFLAGLAWATDETDRLQLDIPGIEAALRESRLSIPDGMAFKLAERLSEEEILTRAGPTYRYAVPLYRRWVAWRWPAETVRQES